MAFMSNFYVETDMIKTIPQSILMALKEKNLMPAEPIEAILGLDPKGFALLTPTKLIYGSINTKKPEKDFWHEFLISDLTINDVYKNINLKIMRSGVTYEFKKVTASQKDIDRIYEMLITRIDSSYKNSVTFAPVNEIKNKRHQQEKQFQVDRVKQMDREGVAYCPKCHSTSLTAHKKGFGIGKAMVGAFVFLPLAVAGNINAKKVRVTCLKCGHQFWAGKK